MESLFEQVKHETEPLAARMRPRNLDEYIGQDHIVGKGRLLRRAIAADQLTSVIFYGPPGSGKTTLARVIANHTQSNFITLNAVLTGVADIRKAIEEAENYQKHYDQRTILFVDEVHRWNKSQQDALLPWVENGTIILIGATTENPFFEVNKALVSRSRVFQLKPLTYDDLFKAATMALTDQERGYGHWKVEFEEGALEHLIETANGDARSLLNALELAVETTPEQWKPHAQPPVPAYGSQIYISKEAAEESIQKKVVLYDRDGDYHYDIISAFIKSLRGRDPDAACYWLARMVAAGEDPHFIFRRMLISACEDTGLADPNAVSIVNSCAQAFDRVGMPEGRYFLAHAALYLATAPKSNSSMAFFDALASVEKEDAEVPNHLKDNNRDAEGFGHGAGYLYPHAYRDHWVAQQYLPDSLQGKIFYEPGTIGYEATLADTVRDRRELQLAAIRENDARLAPPEILTFSPTDKNTEKWLARAADNLAPQLATIRERLFALHPVQRHDLVLDLTADAGAFLWEAVRKAPEGGVWGIVKNQQNADILLEQASNLNSLRRPNLLVSKPEALAETFMESEWKDVRFDFIIGRNFLANATDKKAAVRNIVKLMNEKSATVVLAENIARHTQRLAALIQDHGQEWLPKIRKAEDDIYGNPDDPLVNWDEKTLAGYFEEAGRSVKNVELQFFAREVIISSAQLQHWFDNAPGSFRSRLLKLCEENDVNNFFNAVRTELLNHKVQWSTQVAFLHII